MPGSSRSFLRISLTLLFMAPLALTADAETMVLSNAGGGTENRGVLLLLDTATGLRTQLSDFGNPAQGPLGLNMRRVAADPDGGLVVVDPSVSQLFHVDRVTGGRTSISNLGSAAQGPTTVFPFGVALEGGHSVLLTDPSGAKLFRVDRSSGQRTVLSDFSNPAQGPGQSPVDVTIDGAGRILVSDAGAGTGGTSAILVVDAATGARTLLSDFGNPAQGDDGDISSVVADPEAGIFATCFSANKLYQIHPHDRARTLVADFFDGSHGTVWDFRPLTLAVDQNGLLQVAGASVFFLGFDLVISVDPATGNRVLLSEIAFPGQGATGDSVMGIASRRAVFADGFESGDASRVVAGGRLLARTEAALGIPHGAVLRAKCELPASRPSNGTLAVRKC